MVNMFENFSVTFWVYSCKKNDYGFFSVEKNPPRFFFLQSLFYRESRWFYRKKKNTDLLLKFPPIVEERLFESHSYLQYSRRYGFNNFQCYRPIKGHFPIFWHFWVILGLYWSTDVDQEFLELIRGKSLLQEEQKTHFNHAHISNIRRVTIKRIFSATDR